jgi:hypothetical protein
MDSIFITFIETGFTGLSGFFSPAARGLSAEGRIILSIRLILSNSLI